MRLKHACVTPLILAKKIGGYIYYSSNIFHASHMRHTSNTVHLHCDTCRLFLMQTVSLLMI